MHREHALIQALGLIMRPTSYLYISLFSLFTLSSAVANDVIENSPTTSTKITQKISTNLQQFKTQINVNANAAQSDDIKDPFQSINRKIYAFNDVFDQKLFRPVAVQYSQKVPKQVRSTYAQFRTNLVEPWNAFNQLIQGKPKRAAETLGRFTVNSVTSLGFADVARRVGLEHQDENFGETLGFYGVPSGPYVVLPFLGPSSFRDALGMYVDSQTTLQKYILEDDREVYWGILALYAVDTRANLLDLDGVLTGDKYAQLRDIYLQRKSFAIAQKKGLEEENLFMDDDFDSEEFSEDDQVLNEDN